MFRLKNDKSVSDWHKLNWVIAIAAVTLAMVVAIIVGSVMFFEQVRRESQQKEEVLSASKMISQHVFKYDIDAVRSVGATLSHYDAVALVEIEGARGNLLFRSKEPDNLQGHKKTTITIFPEINGVKSGEAIGQMYVWLYRRPLYIIFGYAFSFALVAFILVFLPSYGIVQYYMRLYVAKPLEVLSDAIDQTLVSGEPAKTDLINDASHLGRFANQFNRMQEKLVDVQQDLRFHSEMTREQADVLEQILAGRNQVVRHFRLDGNVRNYGSSHADERLFDGIPEEPIWNEKHARDKLLEHSEISNAEIIEFISTQRSDNKTKVLYELEVRGPGELLREVVAVELSQKDLAVIVADVTQIRRMEEAISQERRIESLGAITGGVAHDINNMLGVILGNLQILGLRYADDDFIQERVQSSLRSGRDGAEIIQALLNFSRQDTQNSWVVDVSQSVNEIEPLLVSSLSSNIRLQMNVMPNLYVRLMRAELGTAVLNLVVNARDAMSEGGLIRLYIGRASAEDQDLALPGGESAIVIKVVDQGAGIPEKFLSKISTPFFTTKRKGKGVGMGLALVHAFALRYNGTLMYWNNPDRGATFCLCFPEAAAPDSNDEVTTITDGSSQAISARILVVDDEVDLAALLQEYLTTEKHHVEVAHGIVEAKTILLEQEPFDLIITDMAMPDGTGLDVLSQAQEVTPDVPVLLITGHLQWDSGLAEHKHDFSGILTKPVDVERLNKVVQRTLRNNI